jgi:uncharacterized protein YllA (UPF0747 family)
MKYQVIRTQNENHQGALIKIMKRIYPMNDEELAIVNSRSRSIKHTTRIKQYVDDHVLLSFEYNSNSINLYNRMKESFQYLFQQSIDCILFCNSTRTSFQVTDKAAFKKFLQTNPGNDANLKNAQESLISDGFPINIHNCMISLFEVVEKNKNDPLQIIDNIINSNPEISSDLDSDDDDFDDE